MRWSMRKPGHFFDRRAGHGLAQGHTMRVQTMWAALSGVFKWPGAPSRRWWIAVLWLAGLCQQAQAQVFTCDATMYLTQANATNTATQLFRVNRATNPFTYVPIGAEDRRSRRQRTRSAKELQR